MHVSATTGSIGVAAARIGARREVVFHTDGVLVGDHPVPPDASTMGCEWPAALTIDVGLDWPSGYYEVLLIGSDSSRTVRNHAVFVVRAPATTERSVLLVLGTPGYLAKPPGLGRRVTSVHPPDPRIAAHVGYLTINHLSPWAGSAGWPNWEQPFTTSTGAVRCATPSKRSSTAVATWPFCRGNTSFWQVRLEGQGRTVVGFKQRFEDDPCYGTDRGREVTSIWSDHELGRPENTMTGVSFARGGYARIGRRVPAGSGGYTIHRPEHWLFEGTDLEYGDLLGAGATVVGYECDGCDFTYRDGLPYPTGTDGTPEGFEILGTSPAASFTRETAARPPKPGQLSELEFDAWRLFGNHERAATDRLANGHAVLGTYTRGGTVVTTGCTDWAMGLAERDRQVEQVTHNILDRLGSG